MQEWIIAMFVISVLLIVRDMAKTVLVGKKQKYAERPFFQDENPQKEKVKKYAESFQKLSDTFYGMPYKREELSSGQVEHIIRSTYDSVCSHCYQRELCLRVQEDHTYQCAEKMVRAFEDGEDDAVRNAKTEWMGLCGRTSQFLTELWERFGRERQNLVWDNRMIESRLAVAQQMFEMSRIMEMIAEDLYDLSPGEEAFREALSRRLRKRHVILKQIWMIEKTSGHRQMFLTMRARSGQCISAGEVAGILSEQCKMAMVPMAGGRRTVNGEYHTFSFIEDTGYQILYGVAKLTKEQEKVSGDNFICQQVEEGQFIMCLSDGMGSGMEACRESETVVELISQFLESGFSQETAARLVNSALVVRAQDGMFSTVDMCAIDLYTGICNFLKAGASATFIKRDHWVEAIASESLAAGLVQQLEYETASRKLYHGDYLIMMTDGVLDALPSQREEETMKEIIMDVHEEAPAQMSRGILERVLGYSDYCARDDMTVLVAGLWKK